jgi:hypothetical protein
MPYDVRDTAPNSAVPDTYYVPFFNPDGADPNQGCSISEWCASRRHEGCPQGG